MQINPKCLGLAALASVCMTSVLQAQEAPFPGASGMLYLPAQGTYLCAQDVKGPAPTGHFGLLSFDALNKPTYSVISTDWQGFEAGNDIEGLAGIPGKPDEFLAVESGYWMGKYGRLWHLRLDWPQTTLPAEEAYRSPGNPVLIPAVSAVGFVPLPLFEDEIEGLAVLPHDNDLLIIFGLRGGKTAYSSSWLRWGWLDLDAGTVRMYDQAGQGIEMIWPQPSAYPWSRGVSDLYVDSQGMLWASGADDLGDSGPFRSYIHVVGKVDPKQEWPIMNYTPQQYNWSIDGLKVEAIAAPRLPGSVLSFATDDEGYGGVFRPLPPAIPPLQQPWYGPAC